MDIIKQLIRDIPDFPQPGILFKDITPVLAHPDAFRACIDGLAAQWQDTPVDVICGIESRGFIFGAALALQLGKGFVPVRKPGKLPYQVVREEYSLEYGKNVLEAHIDAVQSGQRVLIIDDVLATGGTAIAASRLIQRIGGSVVGCGFVIELSFLSGREKLNLPCRSLLTY